MLVLRHGDICYSLSVIRSGRSHRTGPPLRYRIAVPDESCLVSERCKHASSCDRSEYGTTPIPSPLGFCLPILHLLIAHSTGISTLTSTIFKIVNLCLLCTFCTLLCLLFVFSTVLIGSLSVPSTLALQMKDRSSIHGAPFRV